MMQQPTLPATSPSDEEYGMDKKRALGTGAKCCGDCDLCSDQVEATEPVSPTPDDDFDWGTPPSVDPDDEEDQ